jgi:hypothetical protein
LNKTVAPFQYLRYFIYMSTWLIWHRFNAPIPQRLVSHREAERVPYPSSTVSPVSNQMNTSMMGKEDGKGTFPKPDFAAGRTSLQRRGSPQAISVRGIAASGGRQDSEASLEHMRPMSPFTASLRGLSSDIEVLTAANTVHTSKVGLRA